MTVTAGKPASRLKPGAVVRCRTRRYLVEDVQPPREPGADTVVSMAYMEDQVIGQRLTVFLEREIDFHEEWSRSFGATQGSADALTYNHTDVFIGFPFPPDECLSSEFAFTYSKERASFLKKQKSAQPLFMAGFINHLK